jgi:hypothetical protein
MLEGQLKTMKDKGRNIRSILIVEGRQVIKEDEENGER